MPIRQTRPCVTHANFQSRAIIDQAARLGVVMDIQPAWLYLDTRTLTAQFGYDRLRWFQPLHSLFAAGVTVGGGSDHMQKIGSLRAINPYNPFLGMWTAITRRSKWHEGQLHPEEALTREQAIPFLVPGTTPISFSARTAWAPSSPANSPTSSSSTATFSRVPKTKFARFRSAPLI